MSSDNENRKIRIKFKKVDNPHDYFVFSILIVVILIMGHSGTTLAVAYAKDEVEKEGRENTMILESRIINEISNINGAVHTLSGIPNIINLMVDGFDSANEHVNITLDSFKQKFNVSVCYILDTNGITIASSNRNDQDSFIGNNYSFRPYFQSAITGRDGEYFALGITSGVRGYYNSAPIFDDEKIVGVAVIKKSLDGLEDIFRFQEFGFLVSPEGVIFLSSNENMKYGTIGDMSEHTKEKLLGSHQFGNGSFPLVFNDRAEEGKIIRHDGERYITSVRQVTESGWKIVMYYSLDSLKLYDIFGIAFTFIFIVLISILMVFKRHRRKNEKERKEREEQLNKMNERLKSSDRIKGEYLSVIAHDIGSPLTGAKGNLQLLQKGMLGDLNGKQKNTVEQALNDLDRINEIRKESMDINRINHGSVSLNIKEFNINDLIVQITERLSSNPVMGRRRFVISPISNEMVKADPAKIKTALENYLTNAIRYSNDGTAITVGGEKTEEELILWVMDEGRGMEREDLEMVFEKFYKTGEKVKGSSGLGLAIVKGMIGRHGGRVWADSEGPGRGSTFYLAVPQTSG